MANKSYSLAHTKWMCKYHIVFTPKYRRKIIYNKYREDLIEIMRTLCKYKGVEIIEGHMMPDHVHMLVAKIILYASKSVSADCFLYLSAFHNAKISLKVSVSVIFLAYS